MMATVQRVAPDAYAQCRDDRLSLPIDRSVRNAGSMADLRETSNQDAYVKASTDRYLQRCNGAEPGTILTRAETEAALQRARNLGYDVTGDLDGDGVVSWHHTDLDRTFTYTKVAVDESGVSSRRVGERHATHH